MDGIKQYIYIVANAFV